MSLSVTSIAIATHVTAVTVWVGGMFFAWMVLRPSAGALEPPARLSLWVSCFKRFFPWVWACVIAIPATGLWIILKPMGGFGETTPLHLHLMTGLGTVMILIYMHVFFAPYKRLKRAVAAADWPAGAKNLAQIRVLVGTNLIIGIVTVIIAAGGRYLV